MSEKITKFSEILWLCKSYGYTIEKADNEKGFYLRPKTTIYLSPEEMALFISGDL